MFRVFQRYVATVSYRCCKSRSRRYKSRSGCCTYCNSYARMFQMYVLNVSSLSDVCYKCFYLDVASVSLYIHACCNRMFQVFQVFGTSVASVSSECCIYLQLFSSVFRCFCKCFRCMFQVPHLPSFVLHPF
jgi:hypothetical protein